MIDLQVKNHGISEKLYETLFEKWEEFNSLPDDEKQEFKMTKGVMDRIRFGSSNNFSTRYDKVRFWRDYLKLFVHPDFNSPSKPAGFRYVGILDPYRTFSKNRVN